MWFSNLKYTWLGYIFGWRIVYYDKEMRMWNNKSNNTIAKRAYRKCRKNKPQ